MAHTWQTEQVPAHRRRSDRRPSTPSDRTRNALLTAEGGDFADLARYLFGSVTLDFRESPVTRRVTSTAVGAYRFSELQAGAHTVCGDRVVTRSEDPDSIKILFQAAGCSSIDQGGQRVDIGPGNAVIYDPTRPYTLFHPSPVRLHIVQLPRERLSRHLRNGLERPRRTRYVHSAAGEALLSQTSSALSGGLSSIVPQDPMETVLALFGDCLAPSTWSLATLRQRALDAIDRQLCDPGLRMSGLARSLGCSTRYLHLAFAEAGQTPSECLWQRRLDLACRHLADATDRRTISDVAFALGFSSSAHFSRLFRQRYDCSPRQFRLSASPRRPGTYL